MGSATSSVAEKELVWPQMIMKIKMTMIRIKEAIVSKMRRNKMTMTKTKVGTVSKMMTRTKTKMIKTKEVTVSKMMTKTKAKEDLISTTRSVVCLNRFG